MLCHHLSAKGGSGNCRKSRRRYRYRLKKLLQQQTSATDCPANGAAKAWLIDDADELPWLELENLNSLGISAGASAPEYLVDEVIAELKKHYKNLKIHDIIVAEENIEFKN